MVCDDRGTVTIEGDFATVVSEASHLLETVLEVSYKAVAIEERAYVRDQILHILAFVTATAIQYMQRIDAESEAVTATGTENAVDLTDLLREILAKED